MSKRPPERTTTIRPEPALQRNQGMWLLGAAALTLAPHTLYLPLWVSALSFLLLGWRLSLLLRGSQAPSIYLIAAIGLAAGIGVRLAYGHFFGKDPGLAYLALLLGLKLLETRNMRDIRAATLLSFFLQLGVFFDNQTLPVAALALSATLLSIGALHSLSDPVASPRECMRNSAVLLAQGLPFMLLLFVVFPRVQGPLWGLPADAHSSMSGLSDTMSPGSISNLSLSEAIAFRAQFSGPPPPPAQRYWRGPVLNTFDGTTWRAGRQVELSQPSYTPTGPRIDYRLTLEPHNQRWLLALDFPANAPDGVLYSTDYQALSTTPVRSRLRIDLTSFPETVVGTDESARLVNAARQLPSGTNPRTRELAQALAAGANTPADILARALEHMGRMDLIYTLRPPLTGQNGIDAFLFDTKMGFCEHFSSAFVFLLRAAGVPARVVTGYQGGEINPVDQSLIVRQSDAHAWSEVWLADRGWVRVDPTALAAPGRIESGLAGALPAGEALPLFMRPHLSWLRDLRFRWEAVSNSWNQWVLGYNPERQRELLSRLGLGELSLSVWIGALSIAVSGLMAVLFFWALRQKKDGDDLDRAWMAFSAKLGRIGLAREPAEGPLDYGHRIARARPDLAAVLIGIATRYAQLRYSPPASSEAVSELKRHIRNLDLK